MSFHDRPWIRALRRKIRAEVRSSERLRGIPEPVFTRNRSVPKGFLRALAALAWAAAGWFFAAEGYALRALPYWAWLIFVYRWAKHADFGGFATYLRHLPVRREDIFAHLWRQEWRAHLVLAIEFGAVLGPWLQAHGYGGWGWLIALPIAALVGAASFAFASAAFVFIGTRWMWGIALSTMALGVILLMGGRKSSEFVQAMVRVLDASLVWMSPGGWAVEAVRLLPSAPGTSALLLGAALSAAGSLPILRWRIWVQLRDLSLVDAPQDVDEDEEDHEIAPIPRPTPGDILSPEEEDVVRGEVAAALCLPANEGKTPALPAAFTFPFVPAPTRWTLLYQLLAGEAPQWGPLLFRAAKSAAGGLALLFIIRSVVPGLSGLAFCVWSVGFAFAYLPILGGIWPGLMTSASASRKIPYISLVPVGTWELVWIMLVSNYARLAILGALVIPLGIAVGMIMGIDPAQSATKTGVILATMALGQPIAVAGQFIHASKIRGCVNVLLSFLLVLCLLVLGAFVIIVFVDGARGLRTLFPAVTGILGVLYILSAILVWRYSRRKMDVVI